LPIKYCASRGPDLYAILYEDRRALCAWRAEKDDSIVRARVWAKAPWGSGAFSNHQL